MIASHFLKLLPNQLIGNPPWHERPAQAVFRSDDAIACALMFVGACVLFLLVFIHWQKLRHSNSSDGSLSTRKATTEPWRDQCDVDVIAGGFVQASGRFTWAPVDLRFPDDNRGFHTKGA